MLQKPIVKKDVLKEEVNGIINARDLLEARRRLEEFAEPMESSANTTEFLEVLHNELRGRYQNIISRQSASPAILEGQDSVVAYLYANAAYDAQEPYCSFLLNTIVEQMRQTCRRPRGKRLTKEVIEETLFMAGNRFNVLGDILAQDKLTIGLLDNCFYKKDGMYTARFSEDGSCEHFIFIPHEQVKCEYPQQISFIHEIGHLIHTGVTRKIKKLPESFEIISHFMFPGLNNIVSYENVEMFADSFMMAVTNGTELEELRPAPHVGRKFRPILDLYFSDMIKEESQAAPITSL